LFGLACLLAPIKAHALQIVSWYVQNDPSSQTVYFSFTLNGAPDLLSTDSFGRAKDEFQYYVNWTLHPSDPNYPEIYPDVIVRGGEIALRGGIPIRDAGSGGNPEPGSGGWGPIRGIVPYQLAGNTVTFQVGYTMLGDSDGVFSYGLGIYSYGDTTDFRTGNSTEPVATRASSWGRIKALYH
jgi:hypothetical protein